MDSLHSGTFVEHYELCYSIGDRASRITEKVAMKAILLFVFLLNTSKLFQVLY
jgi:hypothetical protein